MAKSSYRMTRDAYLPKRGKTKYTKSTVIDKSGPGAGYPVVKTTSSKLAPLKKMRTREAGGDSSAGREFSPITRKKAGILPSGTKYVAERSIKGEGNYKKTTIKKNGKIQRRTSGEAGA